MKVQRTIISAILALLLSALLAGFYCFENLAGPVLQEEAASSADTAQEEDKVVLAFHALDRLEIAPASVVVSGCQQCHSAAPHVSDKSTRAFLNMHVRMLDCSVCHVSGKLAYKALPKPGVEPPEFLLTATLRGGDEAKPLQVEVEEANGKHQIGAPLRFDPKGIACDRCHRRGSTMLRALGRYEGHRKRILEDLEILSLLKVGKK